MQLEKTQLCQAPNSFVLENPTTRHTLAEELRERTGRTATITVCHTLIGWLDFGRNSHWYLIYLLKLDWKNLENVCAKTRIVLVLEKNFRENNPPLLHSLFWGLNRRSSFLIFCINSNHPMSHIHTRFAALFEASSSASLRSVEPRARP